MMERQELTITLSDLRLINLLITSIISNARNKSSINSEYIDLLEEMLETTSNSHVRRIIISTVAVSRSADKQEIISTLESHGHTLITLSKEINAKLNQSQN